MKWFVVALVLLVLCAAVAWAVLKCPIDGSSMIYAGSRFDHGWFVNVYKCAAFGHEMLMKP